MCIKQNQCLRSLVEGDDQKISPQSSTTGTYRIYRSSPLLAPLVCTTGINFIEKPHRSMMFYEESLSAHVIPDLRKKYAS